MVSAVSSSGGMSAAALKKMQDEMFKKADANNDGKISKDELSQVAQAKDTKNGPSVDDVMTSMDTNKDGSISRLESDAGLAKIAQDMKGQQAQQGKGAPPAGGPPPAGGAPPAGGGGAAGGTSGSSSTKSYDKKDTNKDGTVSDMEELLYSLKHPDSTVSDATKTSSAAETEAAKSYTAQAGATADTNTAGKELNISL
jgi:EF-hand domain pair